MLYLLFSEPKILKWFCSLWAKLNVLQYGIYVADLSWMEVVYVALDSSYLALVLKAFIIEEFIWQISPLLLEKQKCKKAAICLVPMSRAKTSFPKMLKHIAVCISEYHILCGMRILLICLVQVVDEVHLCVQMCTHVFKIFFFPFGRGKYGEKICKVSHGPFPALDSVGTWTTDLLPPILL